MARGRMINKVISNSEKVSKLSLEATLFYTWCIVYTDCEGRLSGDVWLLKAIFPYVQKITPDNIPELISELVDVDLIYYYEYNGHKFIQIKSFINGKGKHQTINKSKEAASVIPPPPELLQSESGVTPELLKSKVVNKSKSKFKSNIKRERTLSANKSLECDFPLFKNNQFKETWNDFGAMRGKLRKPFTSRAQQNILREIHKITENPLVAIKMLENSITFGWAGVFPLKPEELIKLENNGRKQDKKYIDPKETAERQKAEQAKEFKSQESPDSVRPLGINLNKSDTCKQEE